MAVTLAVGSQTRVVSYALLGDYPFHRGVTWTLVITDVSNT
jgi:hypothetical protein